ncbi:hypothetical protein DOTSEDRAFT_37349 [Dothistroma septosporum NZE10]|uniref:Uncharacterized protein n=1 Tax=Dothistroma septosporum (strain NZE10 / CBS 128990) TaxID=675120 RepID=N1PGU3_DOTSN|nr:hypothetical protein DOTSEDRAFT_37349 [Dothistroma septosporum NZE10]
MTSPTDLIQPAPPILQQEGALTTAVMPEDNSHERMVTATLSAYDYDGPVPGRAGFTYAGKRRRTETYLVKLAPSTTFKQLDKDLRLALERLNMVDILLPTNRKYFKSMHVIDATKTKKCMRPITVKEPTKTSTTLATDGYWEWMGIAFASTGACHADRIPSFDIQVAD